LKLNIFFKSACRSVLNNTHSLVQLVPGALTSGVKRPEREADHSPPSSAEVKDAWSYTSFPAIHLQGIVPN